MQVKSTRKGSAAAKPAKGAAGAAPRTPAGAGVKAGYVDSDSDGGQPAQPARGRIAARRRLGMASGANVKLTREIPFFQKFRCYRPLTMHHCHVKYST